MDQSSKIYVAGHKGMVGSAIMRCLQRQGFHNVIFQTSQELDLTQQAPVEEFFKKQKPDYVFVAAARVGGILANKTYRAEFIHTNLQIQNHVIHSAYRHGVRKLLFFSSSCVYPRLCPQPMKEEHLLTGPLEPTNEPYAIAKLAGMCMCRAYNEQYGTQFISVVPTNLYGPNDCYDPQRSHVMAALIRKFHCAKATHASKVTLWGTGTPRRELMYVEDAADAALFLMQRYAGSDPVNIGWGEDHSIRDLGEIVRKIVGYEGPIEFDPQKPDGAPQKLLDVRRLHALGWKAQTSLEEGIAKAYKWYLQSPEATKTEPL